MVLVINGVTVERVPSSTHSLITSHPFYKESAKALTAHQSKVVRHGGLLYVGQGEYAVTCPQDESVSMLGSDDSTTCHIVVIRNPKSGVVGLGHYDGGDVAKGIIKTVNKIHEHSCDSPCERLELSIVGGFTDSRGSSEEVSMAILNAVHNLSVEAELILACMGELNTTTKVNIHYPIIYGIGVDVKTAEISPCTFPDKGPDQPLRHAKGMGGNSKMMDIYDCKSELLRIGPFHYEPMDSVSLWLQQTDDVILQHLSTSPQVEPPHFVQQMRATLRHLEQHPHPEKTIFPHNRPHQYKKDDSGLWIRVMN